MAPENTKITKTKQIERNMIKIPTELLNLFLLYEKHVKHGVSPRRKRHYETGPMFMGGLLKIKGSAQHDSLSWRYNLAKLNLKCHMNYL